MKNSNRMSSSNRLVVIDGNSLINRAYFAIQRPMITKEGLYTQGVYGFLNMMQKIIADHDPGYLAVAFDKKGPTFRHKEYVDYKAGRKGMPPELAMQMPLLKEVLTAMKISILEMDGYEADDIIGTLVKRGENEGLEPLVVTGDKDALQLASDRTRVLITKKGISEFDMYDREAFTAAYGFPPEQFVDFKALMGDPSDNIPGIPGVGEKTAMNLIKEFGTVERLLESASSITNIKLRAKIEENHVIARMSRRLAEIDTNVPIETDFDQFIIEEPDVKTLAELYRKLEFNRFLKELHVAEWTPSETISLKDRKEIKLLADRMDREKPLTIKVFSDENHLDRPTISGISISHNGQGYHIAPITEDTLAALEELLLEKRPRIYGHELTTDYYALLANGVERWQPDTGFDCAVAQYLLQPDRSRYDLASLAQEYLQRDIGATLMQGEAEQGASWCETVVQLSSLFLPILEAEGLLPIFQNVELPLVFMLASMEVQGFSVDREELVAAGALLGSKLEELTKQIYHLAGGPFSILSPKQLGEVLFNQLQLPSGKKTKTGFSTNAEILEKLRGEHEIVDLILEYRTLSKLKSTYVEGLLPMINRDGKIHAHFRQTVAATGRISCTEPNLQNIPIKQEEGRKLRKAFIPSDSDHLLVGADYSQIELRILAHMSKDPLLIEAFQRNDDIHRATASKVFGVPEDEVTLLQRNNAKAVNFGVIYGMSGFGLSAELGISRKEAEAYIAAYFEKYRKVKEFLDDQIRLCREQGFVTTVLGRKRPIREITASNPMARQAAERLAMNSPIQGSAADIIKLAMIHCHRRLRDEGLSSRLILQVHDELIIETKVSELEQVKQLLKETMEQAYPLLVGLLVEVNTGNNWYELK
ncbi:MAG: DNA polymerase I [Firmicutes bacterium HGW-Firmicutes-11]|jgi:DNA polymerase-1|nr:MAG: DNA polymerase I [Firmicutes bacterium HGW-Firmicutes-11]